MAASPPNYFMPSEKRAYLRGWRDGLNGKERGPHTPLGRSYPNAYAKGYWEGVADREEEKAQ